MSHLSLKARRVLVTSSALVALLMPASFAFASHSWGGYHWARTSNPFTVKLGDNLSAGWDPYLVTAAGDWSVSSVLDAVIVPGSTNPKNCRPKSGRIEVCNAKYGNNGWLGIAQIWISGSHITQGVTKMNDTYFSKPQYNSAPWKNLVVCQEIAHAFGLDHQDENFSNANLGSCMDYTSDPDGPPSNEHPNAHDYEELEIIYAHLDGFTTLSSSTPQAAPATDVSDPKSWGEVVREAPHGRGTLHVRDLGKGHKVFTFVIWADEAHHDSH